VAEAVVVVVVAADEGMSWLLLISDWFSRLSVKLWSLID